MNRLTYIAATALFVILMAGGLYLLWTIVAELPRLALCGFALYGLNDLMRRVGVRRRGKA